MSEKKSFLLYKDFADQLEDLSDEQAGILIKSIFAYQTDAEFSVDDPVVSFALKGLINQFKRDDSKYSDICASRSVAGRKGAKQKLANAGKRKHKLANQADIDTDTDTDTDIETDINTPLTPQGGNGLSVEGSETNSTPKPSSPKETWVAPTIPEVTAWSADWARKHGKNENACRSVATEAFQYYTRQDWKDRNGKRVKSWKLKIAGVWFTDEKLGKTKRASIGIRV